VRLGGNRITSGTPRYRARRRGRKPPSQTWRTFLENHVTTLVSIDFFTVPTIQFQIGEVRQVRLASLYLITFLRLTVPITGPLSCKIGIL
jgi:hypothetical protein